MAELQAGWRWCRHCQVVFYQPDGNGVCPGRAGHDATGSGEYWLWTHGDGKLRSDVQPNWRWCRRCNALAFSQLGGRCAATGAQHDFSASGKYCLLHNADLKPSEQKVHQRGWRWCNKCQALFYCELGAGACPTGGGHDGGGSGKYQLTSGSNSKDIGEVLKSMFTAEPWEDMAHTIRRGFS
ncbi:MAG: hypothetical protein JNL82_22915 [Myxococcales bacterium]|nr:hypothetical protein [Myxococcales bacterium]